MFHFTNFSIRPSTSRLLRVRFMPLLIFVTVALLGVKINQLSNLSSLDFHIPQLFAQEATPAPQVLGSEKKSTMVAEAKQPFTALERISKDLKDNAKTFNPLDLGPAEAMLLLSLSKRRETIEQREHNYEAREALAKAVERRIDQKINELSKIRKDIEDLYAKIQEHNDETTRRLVKVYESMKPKNAASVFEQLNDGVAIPILENMRPQKASDLMGKLTPERAKTLTFKLAERRKFLDIPTDTTSIPGVTP